MPDALKAAALHDEYHTPNTDRLIAVFSIPSRCFPTLPISDLPAAIQYLIRASIRESISVEKALTALRRSIGLTSAFVHHIGCHISSEEVNLVVQADGLTCNAYALAHSCTVNPLIALSLLFSYGDFGELTTLSYAPMAGICSVLGLSAMESRRVVLCTLWWNLQGS